MLMKRMKEERKEEKEGLNKQGRKKSKGEEK
jgi:hypothetical protein